MIPNDPISSIMSRNPVTVRSDAKVSEVRRILSDNKFHHLPVVTGTWIVGIISASDMLRLSLGAFGANEHAVDAMLDSQFTVEGIMTFGPKTLSVKSTIRDAARLLSTGEFHSIPIVVEGKELVGIVTSTDIIRYLMTKIQA